MLKFIIIFLMLPIISFGQSREEKYPATLNLQSDTFFVKFSYRERHIPLVIDKEDTVDMGTDGSPGLSATVYYGRDSVTFSYHNMPYAEVHYIPIQSPRKKVIYRLHFNGITSHFSSSYMDKNKGNVQVEIPEVYELANIIWILSPAGQRRTDLYKEGPYYQRVIAYFKPFLNHPIFKVLDFPDSLYFTKYYDFRENSFAFTFKENKLVYEGPYYYVMGDDWGDYNSLFKRLVPLVEDFARQSNFRDFYKKNQQYYSQQIQREQQLLPVKNMWHWLENQFPHAPKYQSYKVVFSPLIGGSHSTQNFCTYNKTEWFCEAVMFICGADRYDTQEDLNETQKEGLMSGVLFTEIDHNYVNPATSKYSKPIDSIFSHRNIWTKQGNSSDFYESSVSVFNEYMTWAVFCLYVLDTYDKATSDFVINERETRMVEKRNFIKFREFNQALIRLRQEHKDSKVAELYPLLLDWCKHQG